MKVVKNEEEKQEPSQHGCPNIKQEQKQNQNQNHNTTQPKEDIQQLSEPVTMCKRLDKLWLANKLNQQLTTKETNNQTN